MGSRPRAALRGHSGIGRQGVRWRLQTLLDAAIANELDMVRGSYIRCRSGAESPYDPHKGAASFCSPTQKALPFDEVFDPANYPLCYWVNPSLWTGLYRRAFLEEEGI